MTTLEEMPSVLEEDRMLLAQIKSATCGVLPRAEVLLYGSTARGDRRPESDYDILVLTDGPLDAEGQSAVRDRIFDIELASGAVITMLFYDQSEWKGPRLRVTPFHGEVEKDGILL
jgi:predicted nucleotidyltransferase